MCLHTHINHASEITWITKKAANKLFEHGVIVRNQSVLLKGVNNTFEALSDLITSLADINIQPVILSYPYLIGFPNVVVVLHIPMRYGTGH